MTLSTTYLTFCALRDFYKPGSEAPAHTEEQAFNLALQSHLAPDIRPIYPQEKKTMTQDLFITTPLSTLPNGVVVEPIQVGQCLTGKTLNRPLAVTAKAAPLV